MIQIINSSGTLQGLATVFIFDANGKLKFASGGGPGGPVSWGDIVGTLSNQVDLQNALDAKVPYTGATANVDLGEYQLKTGQVEFDQTPTGTFAVAKMRWNNIDGVPEVRLKGGNVTGQMFLENLKRVVNKTGGDLLEANYQVVRIRTVAEGGAAGQRLAVKLAMADSDANSATTLGVVTETILNNQEGFINIGGEVKEIDTTGTLQGESWNDGDILYLSGTVAGQLTNIKPIAPTHTIIVGFVSYKHAIHGKIDVKVDNGYELDELHNVAITTPANNDLLTYESSTSLWKNKQLTSGIVTTALGYTPYNSTNPSGYITSAALSPYLTSAAAASTYQPIISLTTSGTSGPATLVGSTLNIPNYGGGGVSVVSKSVATYTSVGTGSQTLASVLIPAGTFTTGDTIQVRTRFRRNANGTATQAHIHINTANNLTGAVVWKSSIVAATTRWVQFYGHGIIKNATTDTELFATNTNIGNDDGANTFDGRNVAIDWTVNQYFLFSLFSITAPDVFLLSYFEIIKR